MPIAVIEEKLGYEIAREVLREDLEAIRKEPIVCNLLAKDGSSILRGAGFISEWQVTSKTIGFKLPELIMSSIQGLDKTNSIFLDINWSIFNHFSGKYEAIVYKLCRDYVGVGRTPYMELAKFRDYMGIEKDEYPLFKKLNVRLISGPCKKINESPLSDIDVEPILDRQRKVVVGLYFKVSWRRQKSLPFVDFNTVPNDMLEDCFAKARVGITARVRQTYLEGRTHEQVKLCIDRANVYADKLIQSGKAAPNYGAIYRTAITQGWGDEQVQVADVAQTAPAEVAPLPEPTAASIDKAGEDFDRVMSGFALMAPQKQAELLAAYQAAIKLDSLRRSFEKSGITSTAHKKLFAAFLIALN